MIKGLNIKTLKMIKKIIAAIIENDWAYLDRA
jgi:hypothetical protein